MTGRARQCAIHKGTFFVKECPLCRALKVQAQQAVNQRYDKLEQTLPPSPYVSKEEQPPSSQPDPRRGSERPAKPKSHRFSQLSQGFSEIFGGMSVRTWIIAGAAVVGVILLVILGVVFTSDLSDATWTPWSTLPNDALITSQGVSAQEPNIQATVTEIVTEQGNISVLEAPDLEPIGVQSAPMVASWQLFFIIAASLIFTTVFLESSERGQTGDAWTATVSFVCNQIFGITLLTVLASVAPNVFSVRALAWLIFVFLCGIVSAVSFTGGRNLAPIGAFLGLIFIIGGVVLENFGSLQVALNIPARAPLYHGAEVLRAIQIRIDDPLITYSIAVYVIAFIAIGIYVAQLLFPASKRGGAFYFQLNPQWESIVVSLSYTVVLFGVYFLTKGKWQPWVVLLLVSGIFGFFVSMMRRYGHGIVSKGDNTSDTFAGRFTEFAPWDGLGLGILMSTLTVLFFIPIT